MADEKKRINEYELFTVIYKKHRYWLIVFYVISIGLYLSTYEMETDILNLREKRVKQLNFVNAFGGQNDTSPQKLIKSAKELCNIKYPRPQKWDKIDSLNLEYLKNQRQKINQLTKLAAPMGDSLKMIFFHKSQNLLDKKTQIYDTQIQHAMYHDSSGQKGNEIKDEFTRIINDSIKTYSQTYFISPFFESLYIKYELSDLEKLDFSEITKNHHISLENFLSTTISKIDSSLNKQVVKIPNTDAGITTKFTIKIAPIILIPLSLYIIILFLYLKDYSIRMVKEYQNFHYYPLLSHILPHIGFHKAWELVVIIFQYLVNMVLPICFTFCLIYKLKPFIGGWFWGAFSVYLFSLVLMFYYFKTKKKLSMK